MHRKEPTSRVVIKFVIAIIIAIYVLFPFALVVINSCKQTADITANPIGLNGVSIGQLMRNLSDVINNSNFLFWQAFGYSVLITILSLVLLALFGSMTAWVICRNKTKWATLIYFTFIASMIIPFQVVMLPLISTFRDVGKFIGIPMLQSVPGIVFAYLGFGGAMTVFILTGFIKGIPYDLEEAASIDGCRPEQVFFKVIFPLLTPVITTVTILNGMWIWNDYLLPSMMLGQNGKVKTLPVVRQAVEPDPDRSSSCDHPYGSSVPVRTEADHGRYDRGRCQGLIPYRAKY